MTKAYSIVLETGSYSDFCYSPIGICLDKDRAQEILNAKNKEIDDGIAARKAYGDKIKEAWDNGTLYVDPNYKPFVELGGYGRDHHIQYDYKKLYKHFGIPHDISYDLYKDPKYDLQKKQMYAFQNELIKYLDDNKLSYGYLNTLTPIYDGTYVLHEVDILT